MTEPGWSRDPEQEGRALVERLGGRWSVTGGLCRCPAHEDRSPSLSVRAGRSRLLLHCFAGCSAEDVLRALRDGRLLEACGAAPAHGARSAAPCQAGAAARRIWADARPLRGTRAEAYLASRGLSSGSAELRFHPSTPHGRQPLTRYRPALIAAVRDEGGLTGIHRTFLDRLPPAGRGGERCGLGRFGRGAVRIGGVAPRLGLAEGLETALSATMLFGVHCWATLGAERFGAVAIPADVEELLLFLDNDPGGRRAEHLARQAFGQGRRLEMHVPQLPGGDWNDALLASLRGDMA